MLLEVFLVLVAVTTLVIWHHISRLNRLKAHYITEFKKQGFRVCESPNRYLQVSSFTNMEIDAKKGDILRRIKDVLVDHDIEVGNVLGEPAILLTSPKLISEYLQLEKEMHYIKIKAIVEGVGNLIGRGLVFIEGDLWKRHRKILSKIFNFEFVGSLTPEIGEITEATLNNTQKMAKREGNRLVFDYMNFTLDLAANVISGCFLGTSAIHKNIDGVPISKFMTIMAQKIFTRFREPIGMLIGPRGQQLGIFAKDREIQAMKKKILQEGSKMVDQVKEKGEKNLAADPDHKPKNIVEAVLKHNKESPKEHQLSDQEMLEEFRLFFMAATDTTSNLLKIAMFYVAKYPQIQSKLREEIKEHVSKDLTLIDQAVLSKMKYLDAIFKETSRVFGPVNFNFPRVAVRDHQLGGVTIKKGTHVNFNAVPIHYDPQTYRQPNEFRPQRWINGECTDNKPHTLISFGLGTRSCIGMQLAMTESKIAFIHTLRRYRSIKTETEELQFHVSMLFHASDYLIEVQK